MKNNRNYVFLGGSKDPEFYNLISRKIILGSFIFLIAVIVQIQTFGQVGTQGTIFLEPKIITDEDTSAYVGLDDEGQGERVIYDRRLEPRNVTKKVWLFNARFDDMSETIEVQVNPEFDKESALAEAEKYLTVIGQIPNVLRKGLNTVNINKGNKLFAGGSNGITIHTEQGEDYINQGILAETFIHEATHAALQEYSKSEEWINAQKKDGNFISDYARQRPEYEDVAESFLMYIAIRYRGKRISAQTKKVVEEIMPNRIAFFDNLGLDVKPIYAEEGESEKSEADCSSEGKLRSIESVSKTEFSLTNTTADTLNVYWLNFEGKREKMFSIRPKEKVSPKTYLTHPWLVANKNDTCLQIIYAPGEFSIP